MASSSSSSSPPSPPSPSSPPSLTTRDSRTDNVFEEGSVAHDYDTTLSSLTQRFASIFADEETPFDELQLTILDFVADSIGDVDYLLNILKGGNDDPQFQRAFLNTGKNIEAATLCMQEVKTSLQYFVDDTDAALAAYNRTIEEPIDVVRPLVNTSLVSILAAIDEVDPGLEGINTNLLLSAFVALFGKKDVAKDIINTVIPNSNESANTNAQRLIRLVNQATDFPTIESVPYNEIAIAISVCVTYINMNKTSPQAFRETILETYPEADTWSREDFVISTILYVLKLSFLNEKNISYLNREQQNTIELLVANIAIIIDPDLFPNANPFSLADLATLNIAAVEDLQPVLIGANGNEAADIDTFAIESGIYIFVSFVIFLLGCASARILQTRAGVFKTDEKGRKTQQLQTLQNLQNYVEENLDSSTGVFNVFGRKGKAIAKMIEAFISNPLTVVGASVISYAIMQKQFTSEAEPVPVFTTLPSSWPMHLARKEAKISYIVARTRLASTIAISGGVTVRYILRRIERRFNQRFESVFGPTPYRVSIIFSLVFALRNYWRTYYTFMEPSSQITSFTGLPLFSVNSYFWEANVSVDNYQAIGLFLLGFAIGHITVRETPRDQQ